LGTNFDQDIKEIIESERKRKENKEKAEKLSTGNHTGNSSSDASNLNSNPNLILHFICLLSYTMILFVARYN
jgi:hypothetical protein